MMKKILTRSVSRWSVGLAAAALTFSVVAHAAFKSVGPGEVAFQAEGPGGLKIDGTGSGIDVSESGSNVIIKAQLTNLKTGISLRDDHLKKFLKTNENKYAVITIPKAKIKVPENGKTIKATAAGDLAFNGKSKSETVSYQTTNKGGTMDVEGRIAIDFTKYGYEKPCYLGVCVNENVKVIVKFKVKE